jgi:histidinol-phosphatase (PHP family)
LKRFDLHIHTPYCGHATGSAEAAVQFAIQHKYDLLGFSEHFPYPDSYQEPIPDCVVPRERWDDYIREIRELQNQYMDQIEIRLGVEFDYLPGYEREISARIRASGFDYVYGSIHLIENIGIDYTEKYLNQHLHLLGGADAMWKKYWAAMEKMVRMDSCDIIAHFDLPKKLKAGQTEKDQTDAFRPVLELIKKKDCVLELNTGGIDRGYHREPYPSRRILQHAAELGIEMTLGSDAHAPDQIGRHFKQAVDLLKSYGWKYAVVFRNREKEYINLYE